VRVTKSQLKAQRRKVVVGARCLFRSLAEPLALVINLPLAPLPKLPRPPVWRTKAEKGCRGNVARQQHAQNLTRQAATRKRQWAAYVKGQYPGKVTP
jgi:hypothetical protein